MRARAHLRSHDRPRDFFFPKRQAQAKMAGAPTQLQLALSSDSALSDSALTIATPSLPSISPPLPVLLLPLPPTTLPSPPLLPPPRPGGGHSPREQTYFITSSSAPSSIRTVHTLAPVQPPDFIEKPPQAYFSPHQLSSSPASPCTASTQTLHECCAVPPAQSPSTTTMGLSKTQRIIILLGIDSVFFLVELIVGE